MASSAAVKRAETFSGCSTSTKVQSITSEETANNKSSSSEKRRPTSAYSSHQLILNQEVSGESENRRSSFSHRTWKGTAFTKTYALLGHAFPSKHIQDGTSNLSIRVLWNYRDCDFGRYYDAGGFELPDTRSKRPSSPPGATTLPKNSCSRCFNPFQLLSC